MSGLPSSTRCSCTSTRRSPRRGRRRSPAISSSVCMSPAACSNCPVLSSLRPRHEPCSLKPGWLRGLQSSRLVYKQSRLYSFSSTSTYYMLFYALVWRGALPPTLAAAEAHCRRHCPAAVQPGAHVAPRPQALHAHTPYAAAGWTCCSGFRCLAAGYAHAAA